MKRITADDPESRSLDVVAANVARLARLFPDAATADGKVDFDALRQLLGDAIAEDGEKYGLGWLGKGRARRLALTPSAAALRPHPAESVSWDSTKNLIIEGDNLEVLKLLQKSYADKIKLIYIDPPYNTGKDFVYPDNYGDTIGNYLKIAGQIDGNGDRISSNVDSSGRFHTNWLNMMYPRLRLARQLLREDGIIAISISDSEVHNLRCCMDEIFGGENFMGCVLWNSTKSVTNTALLSVSHTYNLIYARSRDYFVANRAHFRLFENGEGFSNPDNDPRGPWKADPFQVGGERPNQMYPVENPNTGEIYRPRPGNSWKNELKVFRELIADNRIVFGVSGEAGPQRKRFLSEAKERGRVAKTWWDDLDTTSRATMAARDTMGENVFDNPKPVSLIQRFVQLGAHYPDDGIVLDFFAGSGTAAQAVLQQNLRDGYKRSYILVQLPQLLDPREKDQKVAANYCEKIGKSMNLAELTKEHMRRFARNFQDKITTTSMDLGFRVFKLANTGVRAWTPNADRLARSLIDGIDRIEPDRSDQDILYEILLKSGFELCCPLEHRTIAGKQVWAVDGGALMACMSPRIDDGDVDELALGIVEWRKQLPERAETAIVFRDDAFAGDLAKTNLVEILRQHGIDNVRSI